jgi:DNA polymerase delta subunit 1
MNWIEIPAGKYKLLNGKAKKSSCQIELLVRYDLYLGYGAFSNR